MLSLRLRAAGPRALALDIVAASCLLSLVRPAFGQPVGSPAANAPSATVPTRTPGGPGVSSLPCSPPPAIVAINGSTALDDRGPAYRFFSFTPGMRTRLGNDWYLLSGTEIPVTGPKSQSFRGHRSSGS